MDDLPDELLVLIFRDYPALFAHLCGRFYAISPRICEEYAQSRATTCVNTDSTTIMCNGICMRKTLNRVHFWDNWFLTKIIKYDPALRLSADISIGGSAAARMWVSYDGGARMYTQAGDGGIIPGHGTITPPVQPEVIYNWALSDRALLGVPLRSPKN